MAKHPFPKDNPTALKKFYGDPANDEVAPQLITVKPPFYLLYLGKTKTTKLSFHKKAAPALERVFDKIWEYYGKDQALLNKLEISYYSGAHAHRLVRGSKTKWSNHAFGAAIDIDSEDNGLGMGRGDIPYPVIAAFKSEGFAWGGDYKGRTDPMHFEACDRGDPMWTFDQWLSHYKCPPMGSTKKEAKTAPAVPKPVVVVVPASIPVPVPQPKPKPKPAAAPAAPVVVSQDRFDMGDDAVGEVTVTSTDASAKPALPKDAIVVPDISDMPPGVYSVETEVVQITLKRLGYNQVGELDGKFGGSTRGAIAAFLNDRGIAGQALGAGELKAALNKAIAEGWTKPVALERANATSAQLENKLPEVAAAATAERAGFWASIATFAGAVITGISKLLGDAVEMLNPIKEFAGDLPWQVWVGSALVVATALFLISRKAKEAKDEATVAYKEGSRT